MTAYAKLLDKLSGVRQTEPGRSIAGCPVHKDDKPSLSIRELGDGRVLIHCFAGCAASDIMQTVGLTLADLFPDGPLRNARREDGGFGPTHSRIPASSLLASIDRDALIVAIIGAELLESRAIAPEVWDSLAQAVSRIGRARDHVTPARARPPQ